MGAVWSKATARPLALARSFDLMLAPANFPLSHKMNIRRAQCKHLTNNILKTWHEAVWRVWRHWLDI